jgi:hypothetical protein
MLLKSSAGGREIFTKPKLHLVLVNNAVIYIWDNNKRNFINYDIAFAIDDERHVAARARRA